MITQRLKPRNVSETKAACTTILNCKNFIYSMEFCNGLDRKPSLTNNAIIEESIPRVSGKYIFKNIANKKQIIAYGRKTNAPHIICNNGNDIPTTILHNHDIMLPSAIAAGRGALSNNSKIRLKIILIQNYNVSLRKRLPEAIKNGIGPNPISNDIIKPNIAAIFA